MTEPIMKKAKGDGVQINLATWPGDAGPILCIHGITANCRCWDVLAAGPDTGFSGYCNGFARQRTIRKAFGRLFAGLSSA